MRVTAFSVLMIALQVAFVILFGTLTNYSPLIDTAGSPFKATNKGIYSTFMDLHIIVFFAFGIMMSMVHRSSFTAAGFSLLLASVSALWGIIMYTLWQQVGDPASSRTRIPINLDVLVVGDYAAAAVLVSYGVLLGRVSAAQSLLIAFWEVIFYNVLLTVANKWNMHVTDFGGSTSIFFYGSIFGLVASAVLSRVNKHGSDMTMAYKTAPSATLAMVATLFAWCFWPSFNMYSAFQATVFLTSAPTYPAVNTFLSLCASTMLATATTRFLHGGKCRTWEAIYATLAGGVAMGTANVMLVRPFGALLIGGAAGILSVLSFAYLQPLLTRLGAPDTTGVFSAYGVPGLFGTLVGIITTAAYRDGEYAPYVGVTAQNWPLLGVERGNSAQAAFSLAYLALALGLALLGGATAGLLAWLAPPLEAAYNDAEEWVLVADGALAEAAQS